MVGANLKGTNLGLFVHLKKKKKNIINLKITISKLKLRSSLEFFKKRWRNRKKKLIYHN